MNFELILSIVGAFIVIGLTINGFFLKNLVQTMYEMRVELGKITLHHDLTAIELGKLQIKFEDMTKEHSALRERVHMLEANLRNLNELIKTYELR